MTRHATVDRERVLDEAEKLIAELGPSKLTLDALAARTGVSKGGLQYVFKSKEGLIEAMLARLMTQCGADMEQVRSIKGGVVVRLEAWLRLSTAFELTPAHTAMLAAVAENPALLKPFGQQYTKQLEELAGDDGAVDRVMAVALAADGLMFLELVGVLQLKPKQRKALVEAIVGLAKSAQKTK